ncbi:unnamed protein product [Clonostachys rosea f. rosea IK726]|uniref:Uncharacterized protein n=1 Tax=Clonostachys rosea f. rosea IK726 TaxID=1349383 RepID=A0ACA9TYB5_BIOOC|nr:unnamed protein product [Clonostachys rosea f. rosea IK726]
MNRGGRQGELDQNAVRKRRIFAGGVEAAKETVHDVDEDAHKDVVHHQHEGEHGWPKRQPKGLWKGEQKCQCPGHHLEVELIREGLPQRGWEEGKKALQSEKMEEFLVTEGDLTGNQVLKP